jgi:5-formyltetrahydrofolate cyclo-ligase
MKNKLRKKFLAIRNKRHFHLTPKQINQIYLDLVKIIKQRKIKIIGAYYSINSELDLSPVLERLKQKVKIALPRILKKNLMEFRIWNKHDPLYVNRFGIVEPSASAKKIVPHLFLTPLLAYDSGYNRLGYGRGYYDHYLSKNKKYLSYGVAFSFQYCKKIPINNQDVPLKGMITEKGLQTI